MVRAQTATAHAGNVSDEVVEKLAEIENVDSLQLTPRLYEVIDPDALDQIFAATPTAGRMDGEVTFSYKGYEVTVSGDGFVSVE